MTSNPAPAMPESMFALTLVLLTLSPLTIAGIAAINAGLGRSRSAAQALLGNLAIIAVTAIVFAVLGSAFAGSLPGGSGHVLHAAGKQWNWLGTGPMFPTLKSCWVPTSPTFKPPPKGRGAGARCRFMWARW